MTANYLQLVRGPQILAGDPLDHELALNTHHIRRFLGAPDDEKWELTCFVDGYPRVAHARDAEEHVRLLREAEGFRGFCGSYFCFNGPTDEQIFHRYPLGEWIGRGKIERVNDRHMLFRRAAFVDVDAERVKGVSSTDDEFARACEVAGRVREFLERVVGRNAIGFGASGNGSYLLVAIEPRPAVKDDTGRIRQLLELLNKEFAVPGVKVDCSVTNMARLMACPGTTKRKGRDAPERPHRRTSFCCCGDVTRVPLEALCV